jgi:hypothetical protein
VAGECRERSQNPWCRRMDNKDPKQEPMEEEETPNRVVVPGMRKK